MDSLLSNDGVYRFNGSGGKDVGPFSAAVTFPAQVVWTNQSSIVRINRSAGQTVTWQSTTPGTNISIIGQAATLAGGLVAFTCVAAGAAGQFTIPPWILLAMPSTANGFLTVSSVSYSQSFSAAGLDFGYGYGLNPITKSVAYQ